MDKATQPSKRKYAAFKDENRPAGGAEQSELSAEVTASAEASARPAALQEQSVGGEGRLRQLKDQKLEFEGSHANRHPNKRLRDDKSATMAAVAHPMVAAESGQNDARATGIDAIPLEMFALIGAYAGLNDLEAHVKQGIECLHGRPPGIKEGGANPSCRATDAASYRESAY